MHLKFFFFAFLALVFTPQICLGQNILLDERWFNGVRESGWIIDASEKDKQKLIKLWEEIEVSLKTTSNPYARTYHKEGHRGYFLRWSLEKGFVFVTYYDGRIIEYFSYGKVSVTDSEVVFDIEEEIVFITPGNHQTPKIWIPAYQGQYFIPKERIQSFGDFYGGFGDFNGFPRRWACDCDPFAKRVNKNTDYEKTKDFVVPVKYQKFIKDPISGEIIAVGKSYISKHPLPITLEEKASITPVKINIGTKNNVKKGLLFLIEPDFNSFRQILKITKAGRQTSEAIIIREVDANGKEAYISEWDDNKPIYKAYEPIQVGIRITTNVIDHFLD